MKLTLLSEDAHTISFSWTPDPLQYGYVPTIDGLEKLSDGKRHEGISSTKDRVTIGKPSDETNPYSKHIYGVKILSVKDQGVLTKPAELTIVPPVGPFEVIDPNYSKMFGVELRNAGGGSIVKKHVKRVTGYGIFNMQYYPPGPASGETTIIEDCIADDVTANPPFKMDGTGEAGFWFGNKTRARRFVANRCSWMGVWTGSQCFDSIFEDFEILQSKHIGLYVEHSTMRSVFRRFRIESVKNGINIEWVYGGVGSHMNSFEDGEIYCPPGATGVFVDAGNYGNVFRRIRFHGPGDAIGFPKNLVDSYRPNQYDNCVFENEGRKVFYHDNAIG